MGPCAPLSVLPCVGPWPLDVQGVLGASKQPSGGFCAIGLVCKPSLNRDYGGERQACSYISISNGFSNSEFLGLEENRVFSVGVIQPALPWSESRAQRCSPREDTVVIKKVNGFLCQGLGNP